MTNTTPNRDNTGPKRRTKGAMRPGLAPVLALAYLVLPIWMDRVSAFELTLPGNARETAHVQSDPDSHAIATGPFSAGDLPMARAEGAVTRTAWRIDAQGITTLQILAPLREQLLAEGFDIAFECEASTCGGFDFRYRLDVFPAPDMHVDLFDYRYLGAQQGTGGGDARQVAILVSRNSNAGFVQISTVAPSGSAALAPKATGSSLRQTAPQPATTGAALPLGAQLQQHGHAVLGDLTFKTGSADLGTGSFASLSELAGFLKADPARRVALVGHTDAVGSLEGNIALSKRRAASVLERLVSAHGVPRAQLAAEGMGYLSPVTSNLTPEGREQNRRVEAVLLNTE